MKAATVLVIGADGQLGFELLANSPPGVEAIGLGRSKLDITDAAAVDRILDELEATAVINCAAFTAVDRAEAEVEAAFRVNCYGARILAQSAAKHRMRFMQISTDFVFDGRKSSPYLPQDQPAPLGVYGQSKLAGERAVMEILPDALIVRTSWLYSANGYNFVKTILRLLQERPTVRVVADQVGTPTSAASLAPALWRLLDANTQGIHHYSDAGVASWYDFACAIRDLAKPRIGAGLGAILPIRTEDYPMPAIRPAYSVLDKTSTCEIVGPCAHWRHALAPIVNQLLTNVGP